MSGTTRSIEVHYWAAARSAAGVASDTIEVAGPVTLAELRSMAVSLHPGTRLSEVLQACSAVVGEQPVGRVDPAEYKIAPGETVEFLPPFAGG